MNTIKTVLHAYYFDASKPEQHAAYHETIDHIRSLGVLAPREIDLTGGRTANPAGWDFSDRIAAVPGARDQSGAVIELELAHLFSDQWNSGPMHGFETGARLFNWTEYRFANRSIRAGYWLEQTCEMRDVLRNTCKCGYCGKQEPAAKGYVFCPHCLDSEHLKEKDLPLTRMVPVDSENAARKPLTQAERDYLLPLYREAQKNGATERGKKRLAAARRRIETEYKQTVADAKQKRDAARWIMDHIPGVLSNWIFYSHSARHCFGWRSPLDSVQLEEVLSVVSEFPFAYEIKCADGRTLSN